MRVGVAIDVQTQIPACTPVKLANGHVAGMQAALLQPALVCAADRRHQAGNGGAQMSLTPRRGRAKRVRVRHGVLPRENAIWKEYDVKYHMKSDKTEPIW
jgi:hypothetical protein